MALGIFRVILPVEAMLIEHLQNLPGRIWEVVALDARRGTAIAIDGH